MYLDKKKKHILLLLVIVVAGIVSFGYVQAAFLNTNRDTKLPPDKVTYDIVKVDEFELLYETNTLAYYFREDRDVFAIKDKRTGYTWKSGIDVPFGADINDQILEAETKEEAEKLAIPQEEGMNTTYTGISNSILTAEYYEEETIKNISSASKDLVESQLVTLNDNPATRRLDVDFQNIELEVKVYITFEEDSISYEIKNEDVTGKGRSSLVALDITPFLGASGGKTKYYNPETEMYDIIKDKYMIPGYIFVPDGSGSLIRFQDNSAAFSMYYGDVYGADPAQNPYFDTILTDAIPLKDPVMPVFGIAHGDGQAAFVAYADSGSEYMQIVVRPEENLTAYNYAYPRFVYNVNYYQVYNKKGDGYFSLMDEPNKMDVRMTYTFLAGDGSDGTPAADYTGMATTYRNHLLELGVLTEKATESSSDIPLRLDFIMSDSKKGIVGTEEVVVTAVDDVRSILDTLSTKGGITNINSGLYGWQQGGETMAKPSSANYYRKIGSSKEFKELITDFAKNKIDISYARDYTTINKEMINYQGNAARHVNSWYLSLNKMYILPFNVPVYEFGYATPKRSAEWFEKQYKRVSPYSDSITVAGMSNMLVSNYNSDGIETTITDAIALYQKTFGEAHNQVKLNFESPNMYLWQYTDRYLQSPVGTSQYVFETDAVPFLQMVLNGTMEVYAPYSNFSFYTQADILRMMDYNLSPSFIVSKEPSHFLSSTPSADLYSTEFDQYEGLIQDVYSQVNGVLSQVIGYSWTGRTVLDNGIIQNTYQKAEDTKYIIINYTDTAFTYEQSTVAPLSASVITKEGVQ
ncbi:MAG: ABC-type transport system, substrate-binding component [Herbinix sp.]|jgi:hypothetical protein|nr:ABC-type transport system, substrate-binding component [Herbinix sp.]